MNRMFVAAAAAGMALLGAAAEPAAAPEKPEKPERLGTLERKAKLEAVVNQRVGGFVERPGTARGSICYVNCQKKASREWVDELIAYLGEVTKFKVAYAEGTFDIGSPGVEGNATVFIVDDNVLPTLLVAPENRWAAVNIAPIAKEERPAFFEARTKKELARAFAYLCGASGSKYERSLTRGITRQEELDRNPSYELPADVIQRFRDYMKPLGVSPAQRTTYLKACQEGWAPQPTNDVQRAIWERVNQIPDKPITIEFDPEKDAGR